MSLATVTHFRDYMDQIPASAATDTKIQAVLDRASTIIEGEVGITFTVPAAASTRTVYGDGTDYLVLPRFVTVSGTVTAVTSLSGVSIPTYVEQAGALVVTRDGVIGQPSGGSYLITGYSPYGGWSAGIPYTIAASYGFAAVPADIIECCLELSVRIWRAKDAGFSDVVGVEGGGAVGYSGTYPKLVKQILNRYKFAGSSGVY